MKTLAFLFLLDYSGSMDQKVDQKIKISILKTELTALLSTEEPKANSSAFIFGSNPKLGCKDLFNLNTSTKDLSLKINKLKVGPFGKTPLSLGLKKLVEEADKTNTKTLIALTDGADSCNQDPCKTLQEADEKIKNKKTKIKLHIIGFDLKQDAEKVACFKTLKLKNIDINVSEAIKGGDLQTLLKNSQLSSLDEKDFLNEKSLANIKGAKRSQMNKGKDKSSPDKDGDKKKNFDPDKEAMLEISGADSTAKFKAISSGFQKDWLGSFAVKLLAGKYNLAYESGNGIQLDLELPKGSFTKIPWARLMKVSEFPVTINSPILNFKLRPVGNTKQIHGEITEQNQSAELNLNQTQAKIPLGEWEAEISSPPWLKGTLKTFKVIVTQENQESIDLNQIYGTELQWAENPSRGELKVLEILSEQGVQERHLIQPEIKKVPILKNSKYSWIEPKKIDK
ncbi:MAG: VWA domain-containing protein [Bdellovibrionaceae bacterium]|nr:VWA domain-containing protein [Pseudobdellovibrionaceae bacterium]NUM59989.1 VWA domain-containing protein [Pseudobdellovibrionaceae bacterium]